LKWLELVSHSSFSRKTHAEIGKAVLSDERRANIEALINERTAARTAKDFAESDRIRDKLTTMGVVLKDSKDGTSWEIAR